MIKLHTDFLAQAIRALALLNTANHFFPLYMRGEWGDDTQENINAWEEIASQLQKHGINASAKVKTYLDGDFCRYIEVKNNEKDYWIHYEPMHSLSLERRPLSYNFVGPRLWPIRGGYTVSSENFTLNDGYKDWVAKQEALVTAVYGSGESRPKTTYRGFSQDILTRLNSEAEALMNAIKDEDPIRQLRMLRQNNYAWDSRVFASALLSGNSTVISWLKDNQCPMA